MRFHGDWFELFPILSRFSESEFPSMRIEEQKCEDDEFLFKYTLLYNLLPVDSKVWRDEARGRKRPKLIDDAGFECENVIIDMTND